MPNDIDLESYPPRPEEYEFSDHFTNEVVQDEERHLDWKKVFGTIKHGEIQKATGSADAEFVRDYHGVKLYVLVGYDEEQQIPVGVTGWPSVHDPRQAVESGRWSEAELRDINDFNNGNSLEEDFAYP